MTRRRIPLRLTQAALACVVVVGSVMTASSRARAQIDAGAVAPRPIETAPTADPAAAADATMAAIETPPIPDDATLQRMMESDPAGARAEVRRAARSSESPATRSLGLRLLGQGDASSATARICARALRLDPDARVRRGGAECLGRVGPALAVHHTAALVAALDDENLDVVTMAGWALANGGAAPAYARVARLARHDDPRVARLFGLYAQRMRARLGLDFGVEEQREERRDNAGRKLVPPGAVLVSATSGLETAAAVSWLGVYGASVGWLHGTLLPSAQGGPDGAAIAPLLGLGLSALGAGGLGAYGFVGAGSLAGAHTVVQLGTAGTLAGFGAGLLAGENPENVLAASNLSLLGTLGGTALGILLVEADATPTVGSLALGAFTGLATMASVGGVGRAYFPSDGYTFAFASLAGGLSTAGTTLAAWDQDVGLFPVAGATTGLLLGTGLGGVSALLLENTAYTETSGWLVLSGALAGASGGAVLGLLIPRELDPMLAPEARPGFKIDPPSWAFFDDGRGAAVPGLVVAGRF